MGAAAGGAAATAAGGAVVAAQAGALIGRELDRRREVDRGREVDRRQVDRSGGRLGPRTNERIMTVLDHIVC